MVIGTPCAPILWCSKSEGNPLRFTTTAASVAALIALSVALPATAASADTVVATWSMPNAAGSMAVSPDGTRIYVAINTGDDRILELDTSTGNQLGEFRGPQWGSYAFGLALSPDGSRLYAASEETDELFVFDTVTRAVIATVPTGDTPRDVKLGPDGRVYVPAEAANRVDVFAGSPLALVGSVPAAGAFHLAVAPTGDRVYVSGFSGIFTAIDATSLTVLHTAGVAGSGRGIAVSPDGTRVAMGTFTSDVLVMIDTSSYATTAVPMVSPSAIAFTSDGAELYVARFSDGVVDALTADGATVLGSVPLTGSPRQMVLTTSGNRVYASSPSSITVIERLAITTPAGALTAGVAGTPYSTALAATGSPTGFAVTSGSLPADLTLDTSTGAISGTPTVAGTSSFTVTATDAAGRTSSRAFTLAISAGAQPTLADTGAELLTPAFGLAAALLLLGGGLVARSRRGVSAAAGRGC